MGKQSKKHKCKDCGGAHSKLANAISDHYFNSEELVTLVAEYLEMRGPNPMVVAFAMSLIDKMLRRQVPKWDVLKEAAEGMVVKMEQAGIVGDLHEKKSKKKSSERVLDA